MTTNEHCSSMLELMTVMILNLRRKLGEVPLTLATRDVTRLNVKRRQLSAIAYLKKM